MGESEESVWLNGVVGLHEGYETEAVARFSVRLLALARTRMPDRLKPRVDPEDVIQSVFRSFFSRNAAGQFVFQESSDVWRLLAAITYRKVQQTIRHHQRQQRDIQREAQHSDSENRLVESDATASSLAMMEELIDRLTSMIPERHRQILNLRLKNYSIEEIAEQCKVSTRTVERALALIRQTASDLLEQ